MLQRLSVAPVSVQVLASGTDKYEVAPAAIHLVERYPPLFHQQASLPECPVHAVSF